MDIHNIDDYLDLQDQTATNLLSSEQIAQPQHTEEWHTATPLDPLLNETTFYRQDSEWDLPQTDFNLQGIIGKEEGMAVSSDQHHAFIAPDTLMKQPTTEEQEEKRVTRSRTAKPTAQPPVSPKKKKTRTRKLYCICQKPYDGKPMVQCDKCEQWFHCTCVSFDPDSQEDIDWSCQNCIQASNETQAPESPKSDTTKPSQRQTRKRTQSKCLYSGCQNRTRADSFCSDVCARKQNEPQVEQEKPRISVRANMRTAAMSVSSAKKPLPEQQTNEEPVMDKPDLSDKEDQDDYVEEKEEEEEEEVKEEEEEENDKEEEVKEEEEEEKEDSKSPEPLADPSQMTEQENPVRRNVIKNLTTILKTVIEGALEENPDMYDTETLSSEERANRLAKSIENTMLQELGDMTKGQRHRTCGERYKSKFRSLLYNLKDKANKVFQLRIITGDLEPSELVKMSSEDMANPELKSMSELLREKGLKNSVMKLENVPIIKKTHKGDIIMVPNSHKEEDSMYSEQVQRELDKINTPSQSPVTEERKTTINSFSPTASSHNGKMDPLDDILARIGIPNNEETSGKRSSITAETADQEAKKRKVALDVEQLLGEEEDAPFEVEEVDMDEQKPEAEDMEVDNKPVQAESSIWHGHVNMPQVAEFEASARQIGGRLLADEEWHDVLSPTMWIEGRIPTERVTDYITQTQYSTSREIVLIEIKAKGADTNQQSQTLLRYLDSRQRYAVVGHNKTKVKDFYLIPLYKTKQIPDSLYVVRLEETKRDCDLFLGVLVLAKQPQQQQYATTTSHVGLTDVKSTPPLTLPPSLSSIQIPPQLQYAISQISALQPQPQQQQNPYNYPQSAQPTLNDNNIPSNHHYRPPHRHHQYRQNEPRYHSSHHHHHSSY